MTLINLGKKAERARAQAAFEYLLIMTGVILFVLLIIVFLKEAFTYEITPRFMASAEAAREATRLGIGPSPMPVSAAPVEDLASRTWTSIIAAFSNIGQFAWLVAAGVIIGLIAYYLIAVRRFD